MITAIVRPGDTLVIGMSTFLEGLGVFVVCIEGAQAFAAVAAKTEG